MPLSQPIAVPSRHGERVPRVAAALGFAGALPFVAAAISAWLPALPGAELLSPTVAVAYGAVILSFLGGTIWGVAAGTAAGDPLTIDSGRLFTVSVVPSLLAWGALLLAPLPAIALLTLAFIGQLFVDRWTAGLALVPAWWLPLRLLLTAIVVVSLLAIALAAMARG